MRTKAILYSFAFLCITCSSKERIVPTHAQNEKPRVAKNVIFMIGDGMGLTQISAASYSFRKPLNIERFNDIGLMKTYCKDDLITDSAAAAAAMSRGIKANKNSFGSDKETSAPKSVIEIFEQKDFQTGIVVTSSLTHATPAAFYTYQVSRSMDEGIALDLLDSRIDFLVGGGMKFFNRRTDERDLLEEFKVRGYSIRTYLDGSFEDNLAYADRNFLYFTADTKPLPASAGRDYLDKASQFGVRFLQNRAKDNGFFCLIEGSQIDWAGHSNEFEWLLREMRDFDKVVGSMLDFAIKDGNTLLVVTADHETGGLSILSRDPDNNKLISGFSTKLHSGVNVPVFAYGPGSELFRGTYDNTEIKGKILRATGQY